MASTPKTQVFIRRKTRRTNGLKVGNIVRKTGTVGEIGIEIEVEGNKFPKDIASPELIPPKWKYTKDGSLRGVDNAEYVLKKPILFSEVPEEIGKLWNMFSTYGSILDESNRTSVHVHLNVQSFYLNRLCAFMALYFSVEELLTEWCGEHRVGNLFCLRAKDAPAVVSTMKEFFANDGEKALYDGLHYAGLNSHAMIKFGSIEIRALRGVTDPTLILDWVAVLERLYKLSEQYPDPRTICDNFSGIGPLEYVANILGDKFNTIRSGISYTDQQIMQAAYAGIRLAQDLCYCRDWSEYKPLELAPDPFDRPESAVVEAYQQLLTVAEMESVLASPATVTGTSFVQHTANAWQSVNFTAVPAPPQTVTELIEGWDVPALDDEEEDNF